MYYSPANNEIPVSTPLANFTVTNIMQFFLDDSYSNYILAESLLLYSAGMTGPARTVVMKTGKA